MNTQEGSTPRSRLKARKGRRSTFFKLSGGHDSAIVNEGGSDGISNPIGDLGHPSRVVLTNNENLNSDDVLNHTETGDKKSIQQEFQLNPNFSENNNKRKLDQSNDESPDMDQINNQSSKRKRVSQKRVLSDDVGSALANLDDEDSDQDLANAQGIHSIEYGETHSVIKNRNLDKVKDDLDSKSNRRVDHDTISKDSTNHLIELQRLKSLNENLLVKYSILVEEQKQNGFGNTDESRLEELAKFKLKCRDLTMELNSLKEEYKRLKEDQERDGSSNVSNDVINSLEAKVQDLISKNKKLDSLVVELTNERNLYKEESENQQYQKDALERNKNELLMSLKSLEENLKEMNKKVKEKDDKLDDINIENESLKSEMKTYKTNLERTNNQMSTLKDEASKVSKLEEQVKTKNQTIDELRDKIDDLEIDLKRLNSSINNSKDKLTFEIEALNKDLKESKERLKMKVNEVNDLKNKHSEMELEKNMHISKLEKALETERAKVIEDEEYVLKLKDQVKKYNTTSYELSELKTDNGLLKGRLEKVLKSLSESQQERETLESECQCLKDEVQRMRAKELLFNETAVDTTELNELKLENQELKSELESYKKKTGQYNKNFVQDIEILEEKLTHASNKLNQSMKECMRLEDELSNVVDERNSLKKRLEKVDYQASSKLESLIEENNMLKLDMNKFSKTALKYQNESSQLKTDLNMLQKKLKQVSEESKMMDRQMHHLNEKRDLEIKKIKKQYIQELRNLQEENLSLTESLNIFRNSLGSQSRKYGSGTQERDLMIKNLQEQLKFFKNKYEGEVDKNRDLQTMNEHYRKLVNQSTKELRLGRQQPSYSSARMEADEAKRDKYRYTSSEFDFS